MTRHLLIAGAAAAALTLAACGQAADDSATVPAEATPDANPAATLATPADEASAPDFVRLAALGDLYEIQSSELALERSKNQEVRAFAQEMIDAHRKTTEDLKTAIASAGSALTPPAALDAELTGELEELTKASAEEFDEAYMEDQVEAHQKSLNLLQRYASDGDTAALQAFAAATAPAVQQHLDKARALHEKLDKADDAR